ncbi:hypothetical protein CBG40_21550 [Mycobacterium tuberculosis]|nr:hypothetical protein CBG40_21550 [Mycobacterium tuberculosis]
MTGPPRSYTGRRDLIAEKLEPYFQISAMLPKNTRPTSETAEEFWDNSLWCSWGDRETGIHPHRHGFDLPGGGRRT